MTWLRQVRPMLYVLGVALVVGSLLGARALTNGNGKSKGNGNGEQKTANPAGINGRLTGPIVLGWVDSEPSPVPYLLPPVLQSGTVAKVYVEGNQVVKAEDPLYEFDTTIQTRNLEKAQKTVAAKTKVASAEE